METERRYVLLQARDAAIAIAFGFGILFGLDWAGAFDVMPEAVHGAFGIALGVFLMVIVHCLDLRRQELLW